MSQSNSGKIAIWGSIISAVAVIAAAAISALVKSNEQPPTPSPGSNPSQTSSTSGPQIPIAYQGNWDGVVRHQYGNITTHLHLGPGTKGQVVGSYDLEDCRGEVSYQGGAGPVELLFTVQSNPSGNCSPTATVRVTLQSSQTLNIYTYAGGQVSGQGSLSRS